MNGPVASDVPATWSVHALGELVASIRETAKIDPDATYELWSVPSFADGAPEQVAGASIGSGKLSVRPDDVLISKINPRINRVWRVAQPLADLPQIASTEWLVARSREDSLVTPAYLRWCATSPSFRKQIEAGTQGVTGSHTRAKAPQVLQIPIPVPPLAEQERIVEILEEHLSRLDAALDSIRTIREKAAQFRRSFLHALFARASEAVTQVRLEEVADVGWGDLAKTKASYVSSGYPAFSASGRDGLLPTFDFEGPGIVVSAIGAACGKSWLADGKWSCIKNTMRILVTSDLVDIAYLYLRLSDPAVWPKRGSGQPFIAQKDARGVVIELPSVEEQRRVVLIAGECLGACDASISNAFRAEALAGSLRRSLLHAAFTGRLTEDWREQHRG